MTKRDVIHCSIKLQIKHCVGLWFIVEIEPHGWHIAQVNARTHCVVDTEPGNDATVGLCRAAHALKEMSHKQCLRSVLFCGYEGLRHNAAQIRGVLDDRYFAKVGNLTLGSIALEEIVHAPFADPQNRDTGFTVANSGSSNLLFGDRLQTTGNR